MPKYGGLVSTWSLRLEPGHDLARVTKNHPAEEDDVVDAIALTLASS